MNQNSSFKENKRKKNKIKMESFKELKSRLNRIRVWRVDTSAKEKKLSIIMNYAVLSILVSSSVTTAWFRIFSAQSIRESTESSFATLIALLCAAWYSMLLWQRKSYASIFDELDAKIEQRLDDPSVEFIYRNTDKQIEFWTKNLVLMMRIVVFIYSMFPIAFSIFKYITSGGSNESFRPIFPASYPFDRRTPIGYFVCILVQILSVLVGVECYSHPLTLTVGFCSFVSDFASDLGMKMRQINKDVIELQGNKSTATEEIWLKRKFVEFVQLHSDAREFAIRFSEVNQAVVFACPSFTVAVFGSLLLQSKAILGSGDLVGIVQTVVIIFTSLLPFFLFCHYGGNVTHQFENVGNDVYQLEWYNLPIEMQKQLPIIIASTQKRIYMRGYGDTRSNHSVFKKILKNKFYYFIVASNL